MNAYPFSVFKRNNRPSYFVAYKDTNGKFLPPISTKKKTHDEALQVAFQWLKDGIPQKQNTVRLHNLSLRETVRSLKDFEEAGTIIAELKRQGWLKSFVIDKTPQAEDFVSFLSTFWDWDTSPYVKEKLRKAHGIHKRHCKAQGQSVSLYWVPFFKDRTIGEITAKDIDAFIDFMGEKPVSASRKNVVIKAGIKPLRWAFSKGIIETDPTRGHIMFSGEQQKRNILTPTAAASVFRANWKDERARLANLLAAITGMRIGEILALRFQDIGPNCLFVRGAWNKLDGVKLPKTNETRTVELPFPDIIKGLIEQAKQNPWGNAPDNFVFWALTRNDQPMQGQRIFINGLREALEQVGFTKDEAKKYMFHGWRHFYTSYMIRKLDKKLLKSQTGHKTDIMLEHYGDHTIEGDRELIQTTQKETFAGLLPMLPEFKICKQRYNTNTICGQ
jgi:integrase